MGQDIFSSKRLSCLQAMEDAYVDMETGSGLNAGEERSHII